MERLITSNYADQQAKTQSLLPPQKLTPWDSGPDPEMSPVLKSDGNFKPQKARLRYSELKQFLNHDAPDYGPDSDDSQQPISEYEDDSGNTVGEESNADTGSDEEELPLPSSSSEEEFSTSSSSSEESESDNEDDDESDSSDEEDSSEDSSDLSSSDEEDSSEDSSEESSSSSESEVDSGFEEGSLSGSDSANGVGGSSSEEDVNGQDIASDGVIIAPDTVGVDPEDLEPDYSVDESSDNDPDGDDNDGPGSYFDNYSDGSSSDSYHVDSEYITDIDLSTLWSSDGYATDDEYDSDAVTDEWEYYSDKEEDWETIVDSELSGSFETDQQEASPEKNKGKEKAEDLVLEEEVDAVPVDP